MSARDFDKLLDDLDVATYLDHEGIDYKETVGSSGEQLNLRECPVCGASKWKVYLNAETGLGNCFSGSCEATFNKYLFIKAHIGASGFPQVARHVEEVARELGWHRRRETAPVKEKKGAKKVVLPASIALPHVGKTLTYLSARNVDAEASAYFHLRYSKNGMYVSMDRGKPYWQKFGGRVIIPVYDLDGELVTFQGRDITGKAEKKYLFPAGLPGTARFLYNGQNAVGKRVVVMNEGAFDVIATHRALESADGYDDFEAVGSFGKALTMGSVDGDDQANRLLRLKAAGLETVIVMWDGEKKAYKAAIEAGLKIRSLGLRAMVAALPAGRDPAEVTSEAVIAAIMDADEVKAATAPKLLLTCPYG